MKQNPEYKQTEKYIAPESKIFSVCAGASLLQGSADGTPDNGDYGENPLEDLGD